jgi:predicted cupin superfamily sugar epimerase
MQSKESIIRALKLEPHIEGGYFRRTFESATHTITKQPAMSSIYYLLTNEAPVGYLHQNKSDIIHFFHSGSPIEYSIINPEGKLSTKILGPNLEKGHQLQLMVQGGDLKASQLMTESKSLDNFGLISEAVCPGFEYKDMRLVTIEVLTKQYPSLVSKLGHLIKPRL